MKNGPACLVIVALACASPDERPVDTTVEVHRVAVPETTIVLGRVERDLTGDGKPELLRLIGRGRTIDSLDVTLTIEANGKILAHAPVSVFLTPTDFSNLR